MSEKKKGILKRVKKGFKVVHKIWKAIIITLLAIALIPLFLLAGTGSAFYSWVVSGSIVVYLVLILIMGRLKNGMVRRYLETTSFRLFLGMVALATAFILHGLDFAVFAKTALVTAAVLYALFLQRISFINFIL